MKTPASFLLHLAAAILLTAVAAAQKPAEPPLEPKPPVKALTPAETIKTIQLPPGYRLELVLAEPDIKEPVMAAFDGDGRLFVVEMRTYMQDVDATGEQEPASRSLANRKDWKLTANHNDKETALAIDGKGDTRYTTKTPQKPGQWFQIELPQEATLAGLQFDSTKSANDYPRGYKVELSTDGQAWKETASGKGAGAVTDITFPAIKAKFIRITQTGAVGGLFWSIHEMQVFAAGQAAKTASR